MSDTATASVSSPTPSTSAAPSAPVTSSSPSSSGTESGTPAPATSSQAGATSTPEAFDVNKYLDKTFKTKINGVEKEVTLAKAIQDYQKFEAANEKFTKAAELEKSIAEKEALFKQDPRKALQELGHDPLAVAQQWLEDFLKDQELSPEQRELNDLRKEKEERSRTEKESHEQKQKMEFEATVESRRQELETGVIEALEKHGLWKDESTAREMGAYMLEAFEAGIDLTPDMAARLVKRDHVEKFKHQFGGFTGEQLFAQLGEEGLKKLKEYDLSRIKTPAKVAAPSKPAAIQTPKFEEGMSLAEYNKKLRRDLGM